MISVRFYSVCSIILLGLLSANYIPNVSADWPMFRNFFKRSENIFDVIYVLFHLSNDHKVQICSKFNKHRIVQVFGGITMVYLDPRMMPRQNVPDDMPAIPTLMCQPAYGAEFFVTYSKANTYYKLEGSTYEASKRIRHRTEDKILAVLTLSQEIPGIYEKDLTETHQDVINYFQSEDYEKLAEMVIPQFDSWFLCNRFPSDYDSSNYAVKKFQSPMQVHGQHIDKNITCVLCLPTGKEDDKDNTSFRVFYYYDNIFFKRSNKYPDLYQLWF